MEGEGVKYLLRAESYIQKVDEDGKEVCRVLMKACPVESFNTMDDALDEVFSQLACDQTMTFYEGGDKDIPKGKTDAESVFMFYGADEHVSKIRYVFRYVVQEVPAGVAKLVDSKQVRQFFK